LLGIKGPKLIVFLLNPQERRVDLLKSQNRKVLLPQVEVGLLPDMGKHKLRGLVKPVQNPAASLMTVGDFLEILQQGFHEIEIDRLVESGASLVHDHDRHPDCADRDEEGGKADKEGVAGDQADRWLPSDASQIVIYRIKGKEGREEEREEGERKKGEREEGGGKKKERLLEGIGARSSERDKRHAKERNWGWRIG